jgi:hypothetical protein
MRERFDLEALDPDDPFELDDGNLPHLAKHAPFTAEDALDAWTFGDPLFYAAADDGPADWLMVARVPGAIVLVPLAPARSGDHAGAGRSGSTSRVAPWSGATRRTRVDERSG